MYDTKLSNKPYLIIVEELKFFCCKAHRVSFVTREILFYRVEKKENK